MEHFTDIELKIVHEARKQFMEKGYEQIKMSGIAKEIEISRTVMHYYFRTKDRLFEAVFGSILQIIIPQVEEIVLLQLPLEERINNVMDVYLNILKKYPQFPRFIINEMNRDLDHLIKAAYACGFFSYMENIKKVIIKEMGEKKIPMMPIHIFLFRLVSQMAFPFLVEPLLKKEFYPTEESFNEFILLWKKGILRSLLLKEE